jgi:hypothetical protein
MCVCVVYLLIKRNHDEFNTIQSHRYSMCLTPTLTPVFFSLSLSRLSLSRFFSTDGSTIEKRKKIFFWEKYKHWIRIISSFNSSTWLAVCYTKGVSVYCSLFFSRSPLITAVGSGIFKQTTAFVRFLLFGRTQQREEFFFSRLLRQYAAIRCNCYFDWRIRPKIQPIIYIEKKEKFISIFYCLLLLQLTRLYMHP